MLDSRNVAIVGPPAPDASPAPVRIPTPSSTAWPQPTRPADGLDTTLDATVRRVSAQLAGATPPVSANPLALPEHRSESRYRRPSGQLIVQGVAPTDLTGGQANDCYLIASLSAIAAARPELIEQIIRPNGDDTYTARFFDLDSGEPVRITVNGALPFNDDKPLYARGERELWGPLIEKAYAARYNGYEAMGEKGGVAQYAIAELTGFTARSVLTSLGKTKTLDALEAAVRERRPMLAQTSGRALSGCGVSRKGIVDNHSYAVLGVERTSEGAFVVLRDPMGHSEFRSKRYDTDYALPGTRARRNDGVFRVRIDDFCKHYFNVVVMTDEQLAVRSSANATFDITPPSVTTQTHIARANAKPPTPVCTIPD